MTTSVQDRGIQFLRRAGLLAGLLAIIAGVLGMHILTGSHNMAMAGPMPAMEAVQEAVEQPATGHGGHRTATTAAASLTAPADPAPASAASGCTAANPCADMSTMGGSCIPSPGTGAPAVPPPTSSLTATDWPLPAPAARYSYLPESLSPGELCISRT